MLTAVTVLKMCSTTGSSSNSSMKQENQDLARGNSGCFAWIDTESDVDLAGVAIVHHRDTTNSGLFVNKDFEDVPSSDEAGEGDQEENQSTDFMSKFANTLALFESEPKVNKTNFYCC